MFRHATERRFATLMAEMIVANPFDLEEVSRLEQAGLAVKMPREVEAEHVPTEKMGHRPDLSILVSRAESLVEVARRRLVDDGNSSDADSILYRSLVLFVLYYRYWPQLQASIEEALRSTDGDDGALVRTKKVRIAYFERFAADLARFLKPTTWCADPGYSASHRIAIGFQIRRAFHFINAKILGRSKPIRRMRAAVWESIFTHDFARYDQLLFKHMHDFSTLITGDSGTGKELVAEAIGQSRYMHFDEDRKEFTESIVGAFQPVNLSAIPSQLIEAELFGNCKGAFTGAIRDRVGWLESCGKYHSVFLDEIGELAPTIQVKLLRVLQSRTFQRVGETKPRRFDGKVIAATNRNLDEEMRQGEFRRDFYYRLCSDRIRTPSLREQLDDSPSELEYLVAILAGKHFGVAGESVARDVMDWIEKNLPVDYPWAGNIRELEQCLRSIVIRRSYDEPTKTNPPRPDQIVQHLLDMKLSADELVSWYCTLTHAATGSYAETARRLGLDPRTAHRRVDPKWL